MSFFKNLKNKLFDSSSRDEYISSLNNYFNELPVEEPVIEVILPSEDSVDTQEVLNISNSIPLHVLIHIKYRDSKGDISHRRITVRSISDRKDGDCDIYSYCHEREAPRMFLLSRIIEISDINTGELIESPMYFFKGRYGNPSLLNLRNALSEFENEILLLIFIGRSDGVLKKNERAIIIDYIKNKAKNDIDDEVLDKELKIMNCQVDEFRKKIKVISTNRDESEKRELVSYVDKLIKVDKIIDPLEVAGLEVIKTIFEVE